MSPIMRLLPTFTSLETGRTSAPAGTGLLGKLQAMWTIRRQRRALMALDDRMLADIGLSRSQAYREASRPFGDLPDRMV
jgi:uncharacterized protein YjiS (DUF1127 family)